MLGVLHKKLANSEGIKLSILVIIGLHHLEEFDDLLEVHREQRVFQYLQYGDGDPQDDGQALANDHVPDDHDHRQRKAINEEGEKPLMQVDRRLDVLPDEVVAQLRHRLRHEALAGPQVAAQQGEPLSVEAREAKVRVIHEACKDSKALLFLHVRHNQEEARNIIHALAVAHVRVVPGISIQHAEKLLLLLSAKGSELREGAANVYLDLRRPSVGALAECAVISRQHVFVDADLGFPDLPSEPLRDAPPHPPVEAVRMGLHVLRDSHVHHLAPLGELRRAHLVLGRLERGPGARRRQ
mmetsp:Transcript_140835/g.351079  ORF Transcript_140835/g.351079 Transcript_140835/m.351079 type:complete len:297 (+) Transcript_140835:382-1272(+)